MEQNRTVYNSYPFTFSTKKMKKAYKVDYVKYGGSAQEKASLNVFLESNLPLI